MNLQDRVRIPEQVMARDVGGETIILDLASGTYFGLDAIGGRIWQLMSEGKSLVEICDAMQQAYVVPREHIERDVLSLAETLRAKQLINAP